MDTAVGEYKAAILISSDRAYEGSRKDSSGPMLENHLKDLGFQIIFREVVPDSEKKILKVLKSWIETGTVDLIITSGGTGVAPTDVTPEATLKVIEKRIPGIEEAMRRESAKFTPNSMLSRSVAGIADRILIINLPGNPQGALENLNVVVPALRHALDLINGKKPDL
ncbi:MAG: MogA/MoaB family molybdenum cofactor biosynthesis protein [Candidatus Zixiibacteriota bacterium]|nr:MAG: MogA/MoaB family molybdenum cofactor biosynthesis protein [candidate division Zixibacteria bacterium]